MGVPEEELDAANALGRIRQAMFGRGPGGVRVGRYQLEERLGAGGEGNVYAARDPELGRRVAVKLLSGDVGSELHSQLLHEARALASVKHPNVVTVYDAGEYDLRVAGQGRGVFIVLELLEGDTLDAWLAAESRSLRAIVDVMVKVGHGLAAVHAAGLVHRDVKPRNILVERGGRAVLADFGIAEVAAEGRRPPTGSRESGTPHYMAPEQRAGAVPDARADQWSFCATLWKAVFGESPARELPTGPRRAPAGAPRVPSYLHRTLTRGLSEDPALRYSSMRALLAYLDRARVVRRRLAVGATAVVGIGAAVLVASPPRCEDAQAMIAEAWDTDRSDRVGQALAEAGVPVADRISLQHRLDAYAREWVAARTRSCNDSRARDEPARRQAAVQLTCLDRTRFQLRTAVDVLLTADELVAANATGLVSTFEHPQRCVTDPPHTAAPPADLDRTTAATLLRSKLLARRGHVDAAQTLIDTLDPDELPPVQAARWHGNDALIAQRRGDRATAEAALNRALQLAEEAADEDAAVRILIDLSHVVSHSGSRYPEGWRLLEQADARARAANLGRNIRASVALTRANLELETTHDDDALERLDEVERLCADEACGGHGLRLLAAARLARGNALLDRGDYDDARRAFGHHLRLVSGTRESATQAWMSMHNLGLVSAATGDLAQARAWYLAADAESAGREWRVPYALARVANALDDPDAAAAHLDAAEQRIARSSPRSLWALALRVSRARVSLLRGEVDAARRELSYLRDEHERTFGADDRRTIGVLEEIAEAEDAAGNFDACLALHRRVLQWRKQELPAGHPLIARSQHGIGRCLLGRGAADDAAPQLEEALRTSRASSGSLGVRTLAIEDDLARAHLALREPKRARALVERALARLPDTDAPASQEAALFFTYARSIAESDPGAARSAAERAATVYESLAPHHAGSADEVTRWLNERATL